MSIAGTLIAGIFALFFVTGIGAAQTSPLPRIDPDSLAHELAKDSVVALNVDSPKGYVARVPRSAKLDSSRSGWSPKKKFERRVYVLQGAGEIVFTVTIGPTEIPETAVREPAYTYVDHDTVTTAGTRWSRTYYLPTRSVRIDIIPYGIAMGPYSNERARIFKSFRWKPGADGKQINVDGRTVIRPED